MTAPGGQERRGRDVVAEERRRAAREGALSEAMTVVFAVGRARQRAGNDARRIAQLEIAVKPHREAYAAGQISGLVIIRAVERTCARWDEEERDGRIGAHGYGPDVEGRRGSTGPATEHAGR